MPLCPSSVDVVFSNRDLAITNLRLLSLPNEVLTMICTDDEISAKDMCAIRLTCKELRAIVEKDFAKRYFQDPFVMMTRESLQALVDICKHPVFGPHVRKVQLLNRLHDPHRLEVLAGKMAHASCWRRLEEMAQARRQLEDFTALIDEQYGLLGSKQALKILSEAFKALGEMGNPITLASQKLALPFRPIGWTKMPDKFDCEQTPPLMAIPEVLSTTQILLDAAKAGDCTSTKLEVGVDSSVNRMHGFQQNTLFPSWPRLNKPLLADMDELCFTFVWGGTVYGHLFNDVAASHLGLLLRCVPESLKALVVRSDVDVTHRIWYNGEHLTRECFANVQVNALERICFAGVMLKERGFCRLLNASKTTLSRLDLKDIVIAGSWDQILRRISKWFSVQHLTLKGVYQISLDPATGGEVCKKWYFSPCELSGMDEVRVGLESFIEEQEFERGEAERQEAEEQEAQRLKDEQEDFDDEYALGQLQTAREKKVQREAKRQALKQKNALEKQEAKNRPLRRSKRLAGRKAADQADQADQQDQADQADQVDQAE
ncbi:hypothetical protein D6D20_10266 [Aureobasidium pullulans]|uniref:F-box domain-containing protein n=1 Tax=Aureobasidium pullulans TaxID=5580 RepID=A0A4S8YU68_AURPU|nr:hypothetical protein D6D20_10266 [Aureobasidium pullulans]